MDDEHKEKLIKILDLPVEGTTWAEIYVAIGRLKGIAEQKPFPQYTPPVQPIHDQTWTQPPWPNGTTWY